jgi:hypothetical protein
MRWPPGMVVTDESFFELSFETANFGIAYEANKRSTQAHRKKKQRLYGAAFVLFFWR